MMDEDDTLTESCEGAVGFMVVGVACGSLRELPVFGLIARDGEKKARSTRDCRKLLFGVG
jgi:hypothetical protein